MLKLDLQLFAHKKGMGSTKNGRQYPLPPERNTHSSGQ